MSSISKAFNYQSCLKASQYLTCQDPVVLYDQQEATWFVLSFCGHCNYWKCSTQTKIENHSFIHSWKWFFKIYSCFAAFRKISCITMFSAVFFKAFNLQNSTFTNRKGKAKRRSLLSSLIAIITNSILTALTLSRSKIGE